MQNNELPSTGQPPRDGGEFTVADVIQFIRRYWLFILIPAALAGLCTFIFQRTFVAPTYEAASLVVVVPPRFTSDLKPPTLSIQAYQTLLESDAVVAETKRRLVARKLLAGNRPFRVGSEVETKIFVSRQREETSLAPMIQLTGRAGTATLAAAFANTIAEVFVERTRELMAGTTSISVQFIENQYPLVRDQLLKEEDQRVIMADDFQKRSDNAASDWDEKISLCKIETANQIGVYQAETRRLQEEFMSQRNLDTRKAQVKAMRKAYSAIQEEQAGVHSVLQEKQLQMSAAQSQLKDTPQFITLQKTITDEALWQSLASAPDGQPDWKKLQDRTLRTQELNPAFARLATRVSQIEIEVNALLPREAQLTQQLEQLSEELKNLDASIRSDESRLEKLKLERAAGQTKLQEERDNLLAELNRNRQRELDTIKRGWQNRLSQSDRNIGQQRELFAELGRNHNQALLAKAQQDMEDIRLGARAVPPDQPKPRGTMFKTLLALVLGGMIGFIAALVREVARNARMIEPGRQ